MTTLLTLQQDAYIDNNKYTALAIDAAEQEYRIVWDIIHPDPSSCDDEADMCDWNKPTAIYKNGKKLNVSDFIVYASQNSDDIVKDHHDSSIYS